MKGMGNGEKESERGRTENGAEGNTWRRRGHLVGHSPGHPQCMRQFADLKSATSVGDPSFCLLQSIILPTH